jgi:cell division protein ZapA
MATVEFEIGARKYAIACRDGEEEHLRSLAAVVDRKATDAASAVGNMGEARHLLFTSLLLADALMDKAGGGAAAVAQPPSPPSPDPAVAEALERLAERMERLAGKLEQSGQST